LEVQTPYASLASAEIEPVMLEVFESYCQRCTFDNNSYSGI